MKSLFILLALTAVSESALNPGLRVKFGLGSNPGTDFFFDVAQNITNAVINGWKLTQRPDGPLPTLVLYCSTEFVLCGFYDYETGYIAGLQISLPQDNFTDAQFDWATQGYTEWIPSTTNGTLKFWSTSQFFVSEEYMAKSVEDRIACRNESKFLQEDAVWLTGFNKNLDKLFDKTSDIENTIFTIQACMDWMGGHFFYNMSSTTPCKADSIYPWFLLVHSGELIGSGFLVVGELSAVENQRDWFERPTESLVEVIAPDGPTCIYDLVNSPGMVAMHIYYIDTPWLVDCPDLS